MHDALYAYLVEGFGSLSFEDRFAVYVEADGFGDCRVGERRDWLREYASGGLDWSHVRDSSPEAVERAALRLQEVVRAAA